MSNIYTCSHRYKYKKKSCSKIDHITRHLKLIEIVIHAPNTK